MRGSSHACRRHTHTLARARSRTFARTHAHTRSRAQVEEEKARGQRLQSRRRHFLREASRVVVVRQAQAIQGVPLTAAEDQVHNHPPSCADMRVRTRAHSITHLSA